MPRKRSESAHKKVVDAALELVAAQGVDATSMDAIAARSGVSKATIYKHWADKEALLLEMMATISGIAARPKFDTGETRTDIQAVLAYRPQEHAPMREKILPHFVAYSASHVEFGRAWRDLVMNPPREELTRLLRQGMSNGELTSPLNLDLCLTMLLGPMLYAHISQRQIRLDGDVLAAAVVEAFWRAYSTGREKQSRR